MLWDRSCDGLYGREWVGEGRRGEVRQICHHRSGGLRHITILIDCQSWVQLILLALFYKTVNDNRRHSLTSLHAVGCAFSDELFNDEETPNPPRSVAVTMETESGAEVRERVSK